MSPSAQRAQLDFVRLAAEEPSSLYFEEFLRHGYEAWPTSYQAQFPGLATWRGVAGLKQSLQRLAGAPADWSVLLASRSLSLVKLAARRMFRVCRNMLTTDLSWPTYQQVIERHARHRGTTVTVVRLRDRVLHQQWTASDVAHYLATAFVDASCDGIFLPAVDHLGVRLPIREIVRQIERRRRLRFCFLDAAQAFCHMPIDDCFGCADFIVAGSHKWMGAYLPTGIGFVGPRHREAIEHELRALSKDAGLLDPLLRFTCQLDRGKIDGTSETANLTPVIACSGAARDMLASSVRAETARHVDIPWQMIPPAFHNWRPVLPCLDLRSRIVLFAAGDASRRFQSAEALRRAWLDAGCIVTAYSGGRVRLAVPYGHARMQQICVGRRQQTPAVDPAR